MMKIFPPTMAGGATGSLPTRNACLSATALAVSSWIVKYEAPLPQPLAEGTYHTVNTWKPWPSLRRIPSGVPAGRAFDGIGVRQVAPVASVTAQISLLT